MKKLCLIFLISQSVICEDLFFECKHSEIYSWGTSSITVNYEKKYMKFNNVVFMFDWKFDGTWANANSKDGYWQSNLNWDSKAFLIVWTNRAGNKFNYQCRPKID